MNKQVVIVCALGLSSSMLVDKIRKYVAVNHLPYDIYCVDVDCAREKIVCSDIVLLAPQISFAWSNFESLCNKLSIAMGVISKDFYGSCDAEAIMSQIDGLSKQLIKKNMIRVRIEGNNYNAMFSLIMKDIQNAVRESEYAMEFHISNMESYDETYDEVILIEPQHASSLAKIKEKYDPLLHSVDVIDSKAYKTFNGRLIVEQAKRMYDELMERRARCIRGQEIS